MWKLLKSPWVVLKRLIGLLVPAPSGAKAGGPGPGVRRVVHVLMVVVVVIALAILNQVSGVQTASGRMGNPILRRVWLPLLFLLFYSLGWLIWWFWQLMRAAPEESPFPDIDRAWEEAKLVLSDARVGLGDAPLFLLLGRPDEGEEALFAGMSTVVAGAPSYAEAPLHVYATREAIYVTCAGASLLGRTAAILAGELILSKGGPDQHGSGADTIGGGATIRPDDLDQEASKAFSAVREVGAIEAQGEEGGAWPDEGRAGHDPAAETAPGAGRSAAGAPRVRRGGRAADGPPAASRPAHRPRSAAVLRGQRHPAADPDGRDRQ